VVEIASDGVVDDDKPMLGIVLVTEVIVNDFSQIAIQSAGILFHYFRYFAGYTTFFDALIFDCIDFDNRLLLILVQSVFLPSPARVKYNSVM
jgi:hypothetical protein